MADEGVDDQCRRTWSGTCKDYGTHHRCLYAVDSMGGWGDGPWGQHDVHLCQCGAYHYDRRWWE